VIRGPEPWQNGCGGCGQGRGSGLSARCTGWKKVPNPAHRPSPSQRAELHGRAVPACCRYVPAGIHRARWRRGRGGWLAELRRSTVCFVKPAGGSGHRTPLGTLAQAVMQGLQTGMFIVRGGKL